MMQAVLMGVELRQDGWVLAKVAFLVMCNDQ